MIEEASLACHHTLASTLHLDGTLIDQMLLLDLCALAVQLAAEQSCRAQVVS